MWVLSAQHTFNPKILRICFQCCSRQTKRTNDQRNKPNQNHWGAVTLSEPAKFSEHGLKFRTDYQSLSVAPGMSLKTTRYINKLSA